MSKSKMIADMKKVLDSNVWIYVKDGVDEDVKKEIAHIYKIEAVAYNNLLIHRYSRLKDAELFPREIEAYINNREYEKQQ